MPTVNIENAGVEFDKIAKAFDEMGKDADALNTKFLKIGAEILRQEILKNVNKTLIKSQAKYPKQLATSREQFGKAIDKMTVGGVRKSKEGGKFVVTGILKGDNSTQFYLKFAEYGTSKQRATPIFRPAMIAKEAELERLYYEMVSNMVEKHWNGGN